MSLPINTAIVALNADTAEGTYGYYPDGKILLTIMDRSIQHSEVVYNGTPEGALKWLNEKLGIPDTETSSEVQASEVPAAVVAPKVIPEPAGEPSVNPSPAFGPPPHENL